MRIFKQMYLPFHDIALFKDNLETIEAAFEKLGITYDSMGFMFSDSVGDTIDKVITKYPALAKYEQKTDHPTQRLLTSATTDEHGNYTLRVEKSEHAILRELMKKTPRPFNLGAIAIFIDNVNWFPDVTMNTTACTVGEYARDVKPSPYNPKSYMSNCVTFTKQSNYGKKVNPVCFTFEIGNEKGEMKDTTELEKKLIEALEVPVDTAFSRTNHYFYFDEEARKKLDVLGQTFISNSLPVLTDIRNSVNLAEEIQPLKQMPMYQFNPNSNSRTSGLSLVKALKKVLPEKTYTYTNRGNTVFMVEMRNKNNHAFVIECGMSPMQKKIDAEIRISGHNFRHRIGNHMTNPNLGGIDVIYPNTQKELEYHIANLATALKRCEIELGDDLFRLYGVSLTP